MQDSFLSLSTKSPGTLPLATLVSGADSFGENFFSDYDTQTAVSNTLFYCLPFCSGSPPLPSCEPSGAPCTVPSMTT